MKLLLLLSVGLGLTWTLQDRTHVPVQEGFRPEQVTGSWYPLALVSTDPSAIEEGGAYHCSMIGIDLLDNGSLNVTYFHRENGQCVKNFYIAEKTDTPGRYTFQYHGKVYMTFVDITEDFIIMGLENQRKEGPLIVTELHGRRLSTDDIAWDYYYSHLCRRDIEPEDTEGLLLKLPFLQLLLCGDTFFLGASAKYDTQV